MMILPVTNIQRFSTHDGPGIRTTVFLKGCPLKCEWCHNPETQSCHQQIFYKPQNCIACGACVDACPYNAHAFDHQGEHIFLVSRCKGSLNCTYVCPTNTVESVSRLMSVDEIMAEVLKDKIFYGEHGGITLSGGEPLMYPEECLEIFCKAKEKGITTAVETSGYFETSRFDELAYHTDLFLWDLKDGNSLRHKEYTGVSNEKILHNLFEMDRHNAKVLIRCIMIKGVNMDESNFSAIAETVNRLKNCIGVELLPYHTYGASKYEQLGYTDNSRKEWIPTINDLKCAKGRLQQLGIIW